MSQDKHYKDILKAYNEKIWLQHPNEEDNSYHFFFKYYLQMPRNNRTALGAYRELLVAEKHHSREEASQKNIPTYHHNWSNARDKHGNPVEGLHTFDERANAYDNWLLADEINKVMSRRGKIVNQEYQDGKELLNLWQLMFSDMKISYDKAREDAHSKNKKLDPSKFINNQKNMIRMREEIATFLRRSVGMEDKITEDVIKKSVEQGQGISVEWVEPENKKFESDDEDSKIDNMDFSEFDELVMEERVERLNDEKN